MLSENPSISKKSSTADLDSGRGLPAASFRLDGPTVRLDPRINAYRPDIADVALAGSLFAPHYAAPLLRAATDTIMMRAAAGHDAEAVSQLLPGEAFAVFDMAGHWAWGYSVHDHYVGYVPIAMLTAPEKPTHRVTAREALLFAGPSIKTRAIATLPFGSLVTAAEQDGFLATRGGYLHLRHAMPVAETAQDAVSVAEQFLGMPYLWGGRGGDGIDCSGLTQIALAATGIAAPRDTDLQREQLGDALPEEARLRRGDIISFPGHVGLMVDETRLLHANAYWMSVVIEPLADVVARLVPQYDRPILSRRRL